MESESENVECKLSSNFDIPAFLYEYAKYPCLWNSYVCKAKVSENVLKTNLQILPLCHDCKYHDIYCWTPVLKKF